jgi:hypothetical protein
MNDLGFSISDLTWNADHRVAFVSSGERADQCYPSTRDAHLRNWSTHHIGNGRYRKGLILLPGPSQRVLGLLPPAAQSAKSERR